MDPPDTSSIVARRILIVEDDFFIATTLAETFAAAGAIVLGPVSSVTEARSIADHETVDLGVLDVSLTGETSFGIATILLDQEIPFLFMSGHDLDVLPVTLRAVPMLQKPVARNRILRLTCDLLDHRVPQT